MNKVNLVGLTFLLGMVLVGCEMTGGKTENASPDVVEHHEIENASPNEVEDNESTMELHTGASETIIRNVEGRDQEVKVINYQLQPYNIAYQLDEFFGDPEVNENQITYSYESDEYKVILEVLEQTTLDAAVSNLQERFETEGYDESFELKSTPIEENGLTGKMQFFDYPIKGFIAYEIDEHVLAITFEYPVYSGDAMGPLLGSLRKSISVE